MQDLETPRLRLRRFRPDDVDFVFDTYSRWDVQRFIGRVPRLMADRAEAIERVDRYAVWDDEEPKGIWLIADRKSGERFGTALLKDLPASGPADPLQPSGETEIGWHLHPDAWGRGIASEAAQRVLEYAFEAGLDRVLAVTHPENTASQAVARRIGMRDEGLTDAYYNTTCALLRIDRIHG
ncbi:GNAT family N-acetyltransferase [Microbacterium rhizosphaerae]|uniref:GNAT family N-acetyltransferase n=1 Tax=Microbacterium rhizosphaerae TaxID=1678237 RepID=A0ABZ0SSG8_9MICO|nr:GNAT family N-acetyltransferase [Microbacterium rhizosphaerae]WPR90753.1 GNAT family N-acetyltransferase [Microbacterium rhizosphaerae]